MEHNSLFTNRPIETINEGFTDINSMTIKELKSEYQKNLSKIKELKEEIEANRQGYPKFSLEEQLEELERYNEKVLKQIDTLKLYKIDTTAYESTVGEEIGNTIKGMLANAERLYNKGDLTEEQYKKQVAMITKSATNMERNEALAKQRAEIEAKRKQREYDKKHPIKTFKKKLSEYKKDK